ncbi:hypothetical protein [Leptospira noguchii]|uniref:Uncharacterized protein n=1 Tax=Leptospira noguchii TaxID=28182 RepID=A0A9Q8RLE3_9LEPT|nr:hypothetical protein [Leptospira noguchii]TQE69564.1 hypothetical protein FF021_15590 [Leptospira noguchii]UOG54616.1 hypothetical protein MAL09_20465 [Leptospira noguchii]UOG58655.1 hypothetical protein MAL03_18505 [Leptospira noguchii]
MKPIDEIIEHELGRFLEAVKQKFQSEVEKGIQDASTGIIAWVTSDKTNLKSGENFGNPVGIYELSQCRFCKKFHLNEDKHSCKGNK